MGFRLFGRGGGKERSAEISNLGAGAAPASTESPETLQDKLTPQEESTAGYYAATATTRSLEDIEADLTVQYKKPEIVERVLKRTAELRAEKAQAEQRKRTQDKKE
jgi:hypothetical protein